MSEESQGYTVTDRRFWAVEDEEQDGEERAGAPTFVAQLEQQLQQKDEQLREYIAAYKQEVVEGLEQTKQRLERDAAARTEQLRGELAAPMLEVLEALERSVMAGQDPGATRESLAQGMQMVHMLMVQKLQELGLERIATVGQPFDPKLHEAMAVAAVTEPEQDGVVTAELRPGFTLGGRLVRAAAVQVGKLQT